MFERFTEAAHRIMVLAEEEARTLGHAEISAEHILLGALRDANGIAARVLASHDITVERARAEVARLVRSGGGASAEQVPLSRGAKKVLDLALQQALTLGHNYIGTEHILLGLVRPSEGVVTRLLSAFEADPIEVRSEVLAVLGGHEQAAAERYGRRSHKTYIDLRLDLTPDAARAVRRAFATPRSPSDSRIDVNSLLYGMLAVDESPSDRGLRDSLFEGAWPLLGTLVRECEERLDRRLDAGDLLILLAAAPQGIIATALAELDVDIDALTQAVANARRTARSDLLRRATISAQMDELRSAKEAALDRADFGRAARLRHEERTLEEEAQRLVDDRLRQLLRETRRRIALDDGSRGAG